MTHKYRERHGGPYDRGSADSYYLRTPDPHYYVGSTYQSERIGVEDMNEDEIADYWAGYEQNEDGGFHKEY
jgi:hypothetical protein|tara:strand:+ start:822 stop:1034 length:213 start_codon:yes stop_codon:yes gene_type:complete